jgi:hypothetical protein
MLDCKKEGNRELINKFLWKVKPCAKILEKNHYTRTEIAPIELLEQVLHGLCERYPYKLQQIYTYSEGKKFKFYHMGVIHVTDIYEWIGDVNGVTLWEVVAKAIIKIYADLKKEKTEQ